MRFIFLCLVLLGLNTGLAFPADTIETAPVPDWVTETKIPSQDEMRHKAPMRVLLREAQSKFFDSHSEFFVHNVIRIQTPEGLSAGNIAITWRPDTTDMIVHYVRIIRNGEEIDVLDQGQTFTVLRREPNLEAAMLDGALTGALQPAGLRVGDVLEYAFTRKYSDPLFAGSANIASPYLNSLDVEYLKLRYVWPDSRPMRWRVSDDLPQPRLATDEEHRELILEMNNVTPPQDRPAGAPARYYLTGMLEMSDYEDWSRISAVFGPLFEEAATLNANSPLHEEARRIAKIAKTTEEQAALALRLVQDDIRYVYLGMDAGAYRPASADETWSRRYGDCKGKTATLLALLHALGIEAEPALVSTAYDDGLGERLPVVGLFDHVIVRAEINGETYWLDGTRIGDRSLAPLSRPPFQWALPVRRDGAALTALDQMPFEEPQSSVTIDIDASRGVHAAPFTAQWILRADYATTARQQLESLSEQEGEDYQESMWAALVSGSDFKFRWLAEEESAKVTLAVEGVLDLEAGADLSGRYEIPVSKIGWDTAYMGDVGEAERSHERSAPYALPYPLYSKSKTTITLPNNGVGYAVTTPDTAYNAHGVELSRTSSIKGDVLTMTAKARTTQSELTPGHASAIKELMENAYYMGAWFKNSIENPAVSQDYWSTPPSSERELIDRGNAYLAASRPNAAIAEYDKAIALNPRSKSAYAERGSAYAMRGSYEQAKRDFDAALSLDERNVTALFGLGGVLVEEGDYEAALEKLDKAIAINSADTFAMSYRASALKGLGRYDEAVAQFRDVMKMEPNDFFTMHELVDVLVRLERHAEANTLVSDAIENYPGVAFLYQTRSMVYEDAGEIGKALSDLDEAAELAPDDPTVFNQRCWVRGVNGVDLDLAMKDCNRAIALEPEETAYLDSRAMVYLQKGDLSRAIAEYDAALSATPDLAASLYGRGVAKIRAGDASGEDDLRKAMEVDPKAAEEFRKYGLGYEL